MARFGYAHVHVDWRINHVCSDCCTSTDRLCMTVWMLISERTDWSVRTNLDSDNGIIEGGGLGGCSWLIRQTADLRLLEWSNSWVQEWDWRSSQVWWSEERRLHMMLRLKTNGMNMRKWNDLNMMHTSPTCGRRKDQLQLWILAWDAHISKLSRRMGVW